MLAFRLTVVHSLPSAMRLELAIALGRFWSFPEHCVEPATRARANAMFRAILTTRLRLAVMSVLVAVGLPAALALPHLTAAAERTHYSRSDDGDVPQALEFRWGSSASAGRVMFSTRRPNQRHGIERTAPAENDQLLP